jgi:hypothetical protein
VSKLQSSIDSGCGSVTLVPTVATLSIAQPSRRGSRPHIGLMPHLDLCDDETAALIKELHDIVDRGRCPLSSRFAP